MYGKCVVTYKQFVDILNEAAELGMRHAPSPEDMSDLTDGADIVLSLVEMGHDITQFKNPYHHKVEAMVLFGDYGKFDVCVTDEVWKTLPTLEQWWESRPKVIVSSEVFDRIQADLDEEDGDETGMREPLPEPEPTDDAGASVPLETPVG